MTEIFVEKAIKIHGDKYDYSKVNYTNSKVKVIIICKEHGEFEMTPNGHLRGNKCRKCKYEKHGLLLKKSLEQFIEEANIKHNHKYDYSLVKDFKNSQTKIDIICKIHGIFQQTPKDHSSGQGCRLCGINKNTLNKTKSHEKFIEEAINIHNNKYEYSLVEYINSRSKVNIVCKLHGVFQQSPSSHLKGHGCRQCSTEINTNKQTKSQEQFIEEAKIIHGDLYDYSLVEYVHTELKVNIRCKLHGQFKITPHCHLTQKSGCTKCKYITIGNKLMKTTEQFIKEAITVHSDKYDYSKSNYIGKDIKVIISCKKHGEFNQTPHGHLGGQGCYRCANNQYSKSQIQWLNFISKLEHINIQHAENDGEYTIPNTRYKVDGYCKETNTIFEYNGNYWHGNPQIYNSNDMTYYHKTFGELYQKTLDKEILIKSMGYNLVTIWESDWIRLNKFIKQIQQKFKNKK